MAVSPDGVADASPGAKADAARVGALSRRAQYCHLVRHATETSTTRARRWCRLFGCCGSAARVHAVPSAAETEDPAPGRVAVDAPPLTFKDFIRPATHVEQLARALGAEVVPTIGQETAQSGPHVPTEAAPVAVISCCGSFVHRMREWGYTPLAAPILDFSSPRGTPVTPSDACRSLPRSFSIFVAPDLPDCRVRRIEDVVDKKFGLVGINDCAASGAGALVAFANRAGVPWRREFYGGRDGGPDHEIVCPMFVRPTGSHFDSLRAVISGDIDVAIVDVIVLMHFKV